MLFFGRKNATDKQPLKKLLSRGIRTQKRYDLHRICKQQYSRKVTLDGIANNAGVFPLFSCMPTIQF